MRQLYVRLPALLRRMCEGCGVTEVTEGERGWADTYTEAIGHEGWRAQTDAERRRVWLET